MINVMKQALPKRKRGAATPSSTRSARRQVAADQGPGAADDGFSSGNLSLHDLFQQQIRTMLDDTNLGEEQKQEILVAAACPCCGAGSLSFTAKIKRRS
jgi:hypothetical protein